MDTLSIQELVAQTSLYKSFEFGDELIDIVYRLRGTSYNLDCFCPYCGKESTFYHVINKTVKSRNGSKYWELTGDSMCSVLQNYNFMEKLYCSRVYSHEIIVSFYATNGQLVKIGQFPSIADIESGEIIKYQKVLEKPYYNELSKAIGLKSHGIGVGSFVYLRRIFEKLLEDAHAKMQTMETWDEESYVRSRVDEKINMLAPELPEFLVENRSLYGILSKEIHELSEQECLEYFDVVKTSIEIILDEYMQKREQEKKEKNENNYRKDYSKVKKVK